MVIVVTLSFDAKVICLFTRLCQLGHREGLVVSHTTKSNSAMMLVPAAG